MKALSQIEVRNLLIYKNIIAATAIILLCLFFLKNAYTGYKESLEQIEEKKRLLEEAEDKVYIWRDVKREYDNLLRIFFEEDLFFQKYVEEKARDAGIGITSLRSSREEESFYQVGVIELNLTSSYKELVDFISELERKNIFADRISLKEEGEGVMARLRIKAVLVVDK